MRSDYDMAGRYKKNDFMETKGKKWTEKADNREECQSVMKSRFLEN
jgi:hypothetical protein